MKIAIIGSRDYPNPVEVAEYVLSRPKGTIIISGGAPGVDSWAANIAHFVGGFETKIYWADWRNLGRAAGFIRNQTIVDNADQVVAFWDGKSRGTLDTINKAKKVGKFAG